ncbi:Glycosyltransferase involved in cell wall bisynthesis [Selenomonas sp. WCT3]|uniref:glycosyltransferase n=1 Tax=Selenomonas sp. WCT3 TaxID=3158785 RepID=UPI00088EC8E2|nr:Glycosyltransferase involved in cell wall bisynthesis [Selenomonas ruminantium]
MIKITACVIVKNEEKCIGRWLESVEDYADEIIVVDTGSTDRTVEMVKAHKAQLYSFAWTGDFSAAKNYALEQATGNWIVFLDADEYFSPASVKNIRRILTGLHPQMGICGVMCRLVNIDTEQNNKFIGATVQVRIFRNTAKLRYYGRVHEALTIPSDKSVELVKELEIIHTGYTAGIIRKKIERNLKLLQEKIQDNGGKITPRDYRYLMDCYYGLGEYEQSLGYAEKALEQAEVIQDAKDHIYMIKVSSCLFGGKDYQTVTAAFDEAIAACPQVADFWVMKGLYLHDQKNYLEAEQCIWKGLQQHEQYKLTPDGVADNLERFLPNAYMVLGRILAMRGKRAEAEKFFIRGLEVQRYQPRLLRELVQALRADELPDDDIIVVLNHLYDKKKDARFLADTFRGQLGNTIYLYYSHQCGEKTFEDEINSFLAARRFDAAALAASDRLDWLYKKGIDAAIALDLPQDSTLRVLLPDSYRQKWQEEVGRNE